MHDIKSSLCVLNAPPNLINCNKFLNTIPFSKFLHIKFKFLSSFSCCSECRYADCHYAECHYAECNYAERHYDECRGAKMLVNGLLLLFAICDI